VRGEEEEWVEGGEEWLKGKKGTGDWVQGIYLMASQAGQGVVLFG